GVVEGEEGVLGGVVDNVCHTNHLAEVVHGTAAGGGAAQRAEIQADAIGPAERALGAAGGVEVAGHLAGGVEREHGDGGGVGHGDVPNAVTLRGGRARGSQERGERQSPHGDGQLIHAGAVVLHDLHLSPALKQAWYVKQP